MTINKFIELKQKLIQVYHDSDNYLNGYSMKYYASIDALICDAKLVISDLEAFTTNFANKINIEDCIKR